MKKKSVLVTSMFALLMSASLVAGATYSLFTSESKHDITVSSGKVKLAATINPDNFVFKSGLEQKTFTGGFELGGTATYDADTSSLTLSKLAPLDTLEFQIELDNQSTVATQYRLKVNCTDGYGLYSKLNVSQIATSWTYLDRGVQPDTINASIGLPDVGNEYQNKSTTINVVVEALQGNATLPEDTVVEVQTSSGEATIEPEKTEVKVETTNGAARVTVPSSKVQDSLLPVKVDVKPSEASKSNFTIDDTTENAVFYDIKVENTKAEKTDEYTVELFAGKGLTNVRVLHKAEGEQTATEVPNVQYDKNTGYVTFKTDSFSPYAIVAAKASVTNGAELIEAINNAAEGEIIELKDSIYYLDGTISTKNHVTIKGTNGKQNIIVGANNDTLDLTNVTFDSLTVKTKTDDLLTRGTYKNLLNYDAFVRHNVNPKDAVLVGTKENFTLTDFEELMTPKNGTVTLPNDVTFIPYKDAGSGLRPYLNIESTENFTLDMAGHKFSYAFTDSSVNGVPTFIAILSAIQLTVKNGTFDTELGDNSSYGFNVNNEAATLVIESGTFLGAPTAFQVQLGTLEVKGGHFDMSKSCKAAAPDMSKYIINCIDKSYKDKTAKIIVTGGEFVKFDPSKNPEGEGTSYVAETHKAVGEAHGSETWYKVSAK